MYTYIFMYVHTHTNTYIYIFMYIHLKYILIYIHIWIYIYVRQYVYTHTHTYIYIYICIYIYIYIYTYTSSVVLTRGAHANWAVSTWFCFGCVTWFQMCHMTSHVSHHFICVTRTSLHTCQINMTTQVPHEHRGSEPKTEIKKKQNNFVCVTRTQLHMRLATSISLDAYEVMFVWHID